MNSKLELQTLKNIFINNTQENEPWIQSTKLGILLRESGILLTKKINASKPSNLRPPTLREFLEKYPYEIEISTPDPNKANMYKVRLKDSSNLQIHILPSQTGSSLKLEIEDLKNHKIRLENDIREKLKDFEQISKNLESSKIFFNDLEVNINKKLIEENKLKKELINLKQKEKDGKELQLFLNENEWAFQLKEYYNQKSLENTPKSSSKKTLTKNFFKDAVNELNKKGLDNDFAQIYLLSLLTSLLNGRFLLLTGHIGTGKSYLVQETGKLLSGVTELIPVRPAWLDASDLLGYFNPLNNTFIATEFTKAIAKQDNDKINIVLLDEMNIARIENYAADILACHNPIGKRKEITLYQDNDSLDKQIDLAKVFDNHMIENEIKEKIFKVLNKSIFNSKLTLSNNLLLCGTLNIDGSTENLPPKMIDRSFMLKFPDFDGNLNISTGDIKSIEMFISSILNTFKYDEIDESSENDWSIFYNEWVKPYQDILLPISRRVAMDYILFSKVAKYFNIIEKSNQYFAYSRLLPRMEFIHDNDNYRNAINLIKKLNLEITDSIYNVLNKYEDKFGFEISYQHLCG